MREYAATIVGRRATRASASSSSVPGQVDGLLEGSPPCQLLHREPRDSQLPGLTVHAAQAGLGCHHILQPSNETCPRTLAHVCPFMPDPDPRTAVVVIYLNSL